MSSLVQSTETPNCVRSRMMGFRRDLDSASHECAYLDSGGVVLPAENDLEISEPMTTP